VVSIDQDEGRTFFHDLDVGLDVQPTLAAILLVLGQHADAVAVDPAKIRLDHQFDRRVHMSFGHAPRPVDLGDLALQRRW